MQADDLVRIGPQRRDGFGWGDGNGKDHARRRAPAQRVQGGARRGAGRKPVIDDDGGAAARVRARASLQIQLPPRSISASARSRDAAI